MDYKMNRGRGIRCKYIGVNLVEKREEFEYCIHFLKQKSDFCLPLPKPYV